MNLTNQFISESYQSLLQISSSNIVTDGTGSIVNLLNTTAATASYISPSFIVSAVGTLSGFATTGSNSFNGDQRITGSIYIPSNQAFFGYLQGTASYALNAAAVNTGSFATTGSNVFNGSNTFNGNVIVTGNLTAQQYIVSSSVSYITTSFSSGSTRFGDDLSDTHVFTGSLQVFGSITGSLQGTSSFARSASFATTASYINPLFISASAAAYGFGSGGAGGAGEGWVVSGDKLFTTDGYNIQATGSFTINGDDRFTPDIFIVKRRVDGITLFKVTENGVQFPVNASNPVSNPTDYGQLYFTSQSLYIAVD